MPDPYLTVARFRELQPKLTNPPVTDEMVESFVSAFESLAERARGIAMRPRTQTARVRVGQRGLTFLSDMAVSAITAVSWVRSGTTTTLTQDELDALDIDGVVGSVVLTTAPCDVEATIAYVAGLDAPPADAEYLTAEYVRARALKTISDQDRSTSGWTDPNTGNSYSFQQADWSRDRFSGFPIVDDGLNAWPDYRIPNIT